MTTNDAFSVEQPHGSMYLFLFLHLCVFNVQFPCIVISLINHQ